MKLTTIIILRKRNNFTKLLAFSESPIKIKLRSRRALCVILLTSAAICKQILHGNKAV